MKIYKNTKKLEELKKVVSEVRGQTYVELYRKLNTKKSENDVYKMTKLQKRKIRDFNQVKYIKDEADRILMKDDKIKNR
jgi:hypothetical protein